MLLVVNHDPGASKEVDAENELERRTNPRQHIVEEVNLHVKDLREDVSESLQGLSHLVSVEESQKFETPANLEYHVAVLCVDLRLCLWQATKSHHQDHERYISNDVEKGFPFKVCLNDGLDVAFELGVVERAQ